MNIGQKKREIKRPNFFIESKFWETELKLIAGMDEVGRGSFAGPLVCAAVVYPQIKLTRFRSSFIQINDSKKLTDKNRRIADVWIKQNCLGWGIGVGSVAEINKKGMAKVLHSGFRRALSNLHKSISGRVDILLIDGHYIPYIRYYRRPSKYQRRWNIIGVNNYMKNKKIKQLALVKGDEMSISIASASIIAKVYRDNLMIKLSKKFNQYGWENNKGYGTLFHKDAISRYGMTKLHRKSFIHFI